MTNRASKLLQILSTQVKPEVRMTVLRAIANHRIPICSDKWADENQDVGCLIFVAIAAARGKSSKSNEVSYWVGATVASRNRIYRYAREFLGFADNRPTLKIVELWDAMTHKERSAFRKMVRNFLRLEAPAEKSVDAEFNRIIYEVPEETPVKI